MAAEKWVTIEMKHCEKINKDVELMERRVYPTMDILRLFDDGFRVRACTCSAAAECNMAGVPCKFAFTNPSV